MRLTPAPRPIESQCLPCKLRLGEQPVLGLDRVAKDKDRCDEDQRVEYGLQGDVVYGINFWGKKKTCGEKYDALLFEMVFPFVKGEILKAWDNDKDQEMVVGHDWAQKNIKRCQDKRCNKFLDGTI